MATINTVKSDETLFAIIESLDELEVAGPTEIADYVGVAPSTVHSHLATLERNELVVKRNGGYRLGLKFLDYGMGIRNRLKLQQVAIPTMDKLAELTGECVWIVVEEHGWGVFLSKKEGEDSIPTHAEVGKRTHLTHTASGKCILAHMPEDRVRGIIDHHGLPEQTDRTSADLDTLFDELRAIRDRGYATSDTKSVVGSCAIAAPILARDDGSEVHGAIAIAGPVNRLKGERLQNTLPDLILGASNEIELNIASS